MGDKGGKKNKDKIHKQIASKQEHKAQQNQDKQPKSIPSVKSEICVRMRVENSSPKTARAKVLLCSIIRRDIFEITEAGFTRGICPKWAERLYPEFNPYKPALFPTR